MIILTLFSSCKNSDLNQNNVEPISEINNSNYLFEDTLICNTEDIYSMKVDTITDTFYETSSYRVILKLYKNNEYLFTDTSFPCSGGGLCLKNFINKSKESVEDSYNVIEKGKKKYNLYVLSEDKLLFYSYFNFLFSKDSLGQWKSFYLPVYPQYISRLVKIIVLENEKKISFVGENADLAGNRYKGDSLVISYKDSFFIDGYYPQSKFPGVKYYELEDD